MRPLCRFVPVSVDPQALSELLTFRFAAAPRSNLSGIERVPPGTHLHWKPDGSRAVATFRRGIDTLDPTWAPSLEEAVEVTHDALVRSVRDHMQSDVGFALQLSGGIDSALIAAIAAKESGTRLASYGILLEDKKYDESPYRAAIVETYGLDHTEVPVTGRMFADALPAANAAMEGPTPHLGCVALMLLCREIAKRHKVVLTGEGADELFGGYYRYQIWPELARRDRLGRLAPPWFWRATRRWAHLASLSRAGDGALLGAVFHDVDATLRLFPGLPFTGGSRTAVARAFPDFRHRMLATDQTAYLESLLLRQDKMSMASSVEARVPFTHLPLWARPFNRISLDLRMPEGRPSRCLKPLLARYLPSRHVDRPPQKRP
jgi:asparagine synthase (glutamine-hydrolysing)